MSPMTAYSTTSINAVAKRMANAPYQLWKYHGTQLAAKPTTTIVTPNPWGKSLRRNSSWLGQTTHRETPSCVTTSAGVFRSSPQWIHARWDDDSANSDRVVRSQSGQA